MDDYINRFRRKVGAGATISGQIEDLIAESTSKVEVYLEGNENAIPVAFINKDKETGDEAVMYTYAEDGVAVGNYITFLDKTYLVYKEIRNIKRENFIKAFNLIGCNIHFTHLVNNIATDIKAFFRGSLRSPRLEERSLADELGITSIDKVYILLPSKYKMRVNEDINITDIDGVDKGWKTTVVDSISNPGISYVAMREFSIADTNKISETQKPDYDPTLKELIAGIEYTFDTQSAFIKANKPIKIISRAATSVKFSVPFGTGDIIITIKKDGLESSTSYVVRG